VGVDPGVSLRRPMGQRLVRVLAPGLTQVDRLTSSGCPDIDPSTWARAPAPTPTGWTGWPT